MLEVNGKDTFEDRVNIVLDELSLGIQWERPSLIVLIYRSEHIKNIVQAILAKSLGESGQVVLHYAVDKYHYDIPRELLDHPKHKQAVFFVSGLRWGGGRGYSNAYRALNMHREYLVEGNIKAIFWLTQNEVKQSARFSPDFWAFRHKVVEFFDLPSIKEIKPLESSNGSFHNLYTKNANDFLIWINTAEMFYALGCIDEAILNFRKALRKYPDETAIYLQIAEIYLYMGRLSAAGRILKKANKGKTDKIYFLKELNRLNQVANSMPHASGGFLEQTT
ncbi:MAG: tetratricopeptide repeat protein [bacterium]|nr:tetratricopeptide repeat protein [bacterium]